MISMAHNLEKEVKNPSLSIDESVIMPSDSVGEIELTDRELEAVYGACGEQGCDNNWDNGCDDNWDQDNNWDCDNNWDYDNRCHPHYKRPRRVCFWQ